MMMEIAKMLKTLHTWPRETKSICPKLLLCQISLTTLLARGCCLRVQPTLIWANLRVRGPLLVVILANNCKNYSISSALTRDQGLAMMISVLIQLIQEKQSSRVPIKRVNQGAWMGILQRNRVNWVIISVNQEASRTVNLKSIETLPIKLRKLFKKASSLDLV